MIHWLVGSFADHPDLARGVPPAGLLSPAESRRLVNLRTAKRRRDWLLGRWTAKHLLQTAVEREGGTRLPLTAFSVDNEVNGAPTIKLDSHSLGPYQTGDMAYLTKTCPL